ncbi:MAG: hypothetical protein M3P50_05790 [Actinomycetota bacterium]|nr:hypothetical protein [Actinomycetota bacterium]
MSTADAEAPLDKVVDGMVKDKFPEGLVRVLETKFPNAAHADVEDAVATGFEKLVRADRAMDNPRGYVTTVAVNALKRILRLAALEQLAVHDEDGDEGDGDGEVFDRGTDPWTNPTLDEAVANDAYAFMRSLVEMWESRNVRTTTLLVLDAARLQEPLSSAEMAERLEELLGQDVLADTARQWRKRGIDRLRGQLVAAGLLEPTEEA